jgi:phosphoglycolate phosphatase-like HAD superfamily hydrolase
MTVDEECFVQAFADVFSIYDLNTNWMEYEHVTDLGVLYGVFRSTFRRLPERNEIANFADYFVGLLRERHAINNDGFGQIPGAGSLLAKLTNHAEWRVAIATGCLEVSAKFKLHTAGLPANEIPAAYSEDGPSREAIVRAAIERAKERYGERTFQRIVSVGDTVWDVRTARRLELPFVGIGAGTRAELLRNKGAKTVIQDFTDYDQCMVSFEEAEMPA